MNRLSRMVEAAVKMEAVLRRTREGQRRRRKDEMGSLLWMAGCQSEQSKEKPLAHGVHPA